MNMIKNLLIYTVFTGIGSVTLAYYFISAYMLQFTILSLIGTSLLCTVYEIITEEKKFSLNFENVHQGPNSKYSADSDQMSIVYHTIGTIIAGAIVLL